MTHLFHKWSRWRVTVTNGTVQYSGHTYQVRQCLVCGFVQCEKVESYADVSAPFKNETSDA